uniref:Uncharacterized protein n=1 Tax=Arundo donax TaxID=35708 RepID=A0A0A8ZRP0_ARUDO
MELICLVATWKNGSSQHG